MFAFKISFDPITYLSQFLNLPGKSMLMTWPHTLVILFLTVCHSCTEHAPLKPFL